MLPTLQDGPIVWRPTPAALRRSRVRRLIERAGLPDYDAFLARARDDPDWFWRTTLADLGIAFDRPFRQVLDTSRGWAWTRWFVDGQFNYVRQAVDRWAADPDHRRRTALIGEGDDGTVRRLTWGGLHRAVNALAAALATRLGVRAGDRVGIYLPMAPEAAIATLAVNRIGAIGVPIFSGYGPDAVATRLVDGGCRVLITADGCLRRGQIVPLKEQADAALDRAPGVEHVVVWSRLGRSIAWRRRDHRWDRLLAGAPDHAPPAPTESETPCLILYTSGTTGRPKGALHVHAGFPLKAAQDLAHCFDLHAGDTLFWFTDLGWMMGPWAIMGALLLGARCLMFEGTPDHPTPDRLWAVAARHGATVLGVAPTAIRALMAHGEEWPARHPLPRLRILGSTGEPWNPEAWLWYFHHVGRGRLPIVNYSGGTEISGGILGCTTLRPLKPACFNTVVPGMDAVVLDETGRPAPVGSVGELALRRPWPGMTRGFWNDPDGSRYLETYWSRWPEIWVHGDWAMVDREGFWYILGRSDDTIKVAGKRVGPAEVESAAMGHPAVREAAAIGVPHPLKGEGVVLFCVLKGSPAPTDALREAIADQVARALGKPLRPERVLFVAELPRTRNAKVLRRLVRARYLGRTELGDLSALENPSALTAIDEAR